MHNSFENLQSRCKKYHLKKILKIVLLISIPFLLIGAGYIYLLTPGQDVQNIKIKQKPKVAVKEIKPKIEHKQKSKIIVKEVVVEKEDKQIYKDVNYALDFDSNYKHKKTANKQVEKKPKIIKQPESIVKAKELPVVKEEKKIEVKFKKYDSIDEMTRLYEKEKKYDLALKIAESFYKKKNFSNALLWAKNANLLDKRADGAWIVYAKSEYAKGNIKRAKEILGLYLANADSNEAKILLLSWKKGQ